MRRLVPASCLSVLLHVFVLVPGLVALATAAPTEAEPKPQFVQAVPADEEQPPTVGRETSTTSTLTWIGHEEYEEHLARLSEVEQAAFTKSPPQPAGAPRLMQSAEQVREALTAAAAGAAANASRLAERMQSMLDLVAEVSGEIATAAVPRNVPSETPEQTTNPTDASDEPATEDPNPSEDPAAEETPPIDPAPETAPPGGKPTDPGHVDDRESDPTSTVDVPLKDLKIGKPLPANGVEIFTESPEFTPLVRLTALPRNPVGRITFDHNGFASSVVLIQKSGHSSVDHTVRTTLHNWTAAGPRIDALEPGETFIFTVRIILR